MSFSSAPIYNLYWNDRSILKPARVYNLRHVEDIFRSRFFIVTSNCEPEGRQAATPTATPTPAERRNWP